MRKKVLKQYLAKNKLLNWFILVFLGIAIASWCVTMVKSGLEYSYGIGFWGANGHDGVWHIAISNGLSNLNLDNQIFSGAKIKNYHIGYDLILAILNRLTGISVSNLYFQFFPILFSVLIALFFYLFIVEWRNSKFEFFWAAFFLYFGGSFGWIVNLFRGEQLGGESMFWAQQSVSTLINPPYAFSLMVIFIGLFCLNRYIEKNKIIYFWSSAILFGLLIEIKSYAGVLVLIGLFLIGLIQFVKERKKSLLALWFVSFLISILIFIPVSGFDSKILIFKPFWFLENMLGSVDRFYWPKLFSAINTYKESGIYLKLFLGYLLAFIIFVIGNFGTRLFIFTRKPNFSYINSFFYILIFFGILLPTLFVQKGTPWNTIQFLYYSLVFSGILAGVNFAQLIKNKSKVFICFVSFLMIIVTIPTTISTLFSVYIPNRSPAKLSNNEISALKFLRQLPDGIVLTYPFDKYKADEAISNPPRPLYLYESTAYVSAFSSKKVFMEDEVNLEILGFDWQNRKIAMQDFFNSNNINEASMFLVNNNIEYLYLIKGQDVNVDLAKLKLIKIYENEEVLLYRFEKM